MKKLFNTIMILLILITTLNPALLSASSQTRSEITEPTMISSIFPDSEVRSKISEILCVNQNYLVTQEELDTIKELVLGSPMNADSIEGVQYLSNLEIFSSVYDQIIDLTPLSNLPNLIYLNINDVSFDLNGHGINKPDDQIIDYGNEVNLPSDPISLSHKFIGWSTTIDNSSGLFDFISVITGDTTLYAQWAPITSVVNFDLNGFDSTVIDSQIVDYNDQIKEPTKPISISQEFIGWTTTPDNSSGLYDFTTPVTKDVVLYAIWSTNSLPVLNVDSFVEINVGDSFDELSGVTASDLEDGNLTDSIVIVSNNVDVKTAGIYQVMYQVIDSDGNTVSKVRTVLVNDGTYVFDNHYIIHGNDFVIKSSQVNDSDELFTMYGDVQVYDTETQTYIDNPELIIDRSQLKTESGTYPVKFSFNPSLVLNVTVVEDDIILTDTIEKPTINVSTSVLATTGSRNIPLIVGIIMILLSMMCLYIGRRPRNK